MSAAIDNGPPPRVWICLPTYNEAENIERMVRRLLEMLRTSGIDGTILVIDDASPDGTGHLADALAASDAHVQVLHRSRKEGIGPAYVAGFQRALAAGADLVMEMDCDFSHDPDDVPRLVAAASSADVVLGSRYVAGGRVENWGLVRRMISQGGSLYARKVLAVDVRDLTGGFKCFRADVLKGLPLEDVASAGYVFQIEMTYRALKAGWLVTEIPITFRDRSAGTSKMSRGIVLEAAWRVPFLRRRLADRSGQRTTSART